jgi:hypothetical protein
MVNMDSESGKPITTHDKAVYVGEPRPRLYCPTCGGKANDLYFFTCDEINTLTPNEFDNLKNIREK